MMAKGIAREFAERVFEQIRGFGDYGFPGKPRGELRADRLRHRLAPLPLPGGVRLLAASTRSRWGSTPRPRSSGDAIRHGVEVCPVDVTASAWDCTLEPLDAPVSRPAFAVRMGLRYVKSLSEGRDWRRIETARTKRPFASMEDFTRRTRLDERVVRRLAEAGAFARFEGERRIALWEALDLGRVPASALPITLREPRPDFEPLGEFETIAWDYRFSAHSTRGHPLAPLRDALASRKLPDARAVAAMPGRAPGALRRHRDSAGNALPLRRA